MVLKSWERGEEQPTQVLQSIWGYYFYKATPHQEELIQSCFTRLSSPSVRFILSLSIYWVLAPSLLQATIAAQFLAEDSEERLLPQASDGLERGTSKCTFPSHPLGDTRTPLRVTLFYSPVWEPQASRFKSTSLADISISHTTQETRLPSDVALSWGFTCCPCNGKVVRFCLGFLTVVAQHCLFIPFSTTPSSHCLSCTSVGKSNLSRPQPVFAGGPWLLPVKTGLAVSFMPAAWQQHFLYDPFSQMIG